MTWLRLEDRKSSRISHGHPFDGANRETWPEIMDWLVQHIQRLEKVFAPALEAVRKDLLQ